MRRAGLTPNQMENPLVLQEDGMPMMAIRCEA